MSGPDERHSRPMKAEGDIPFEVRETYARLQSEELDGPPDLLDQAVLNRARAAVEPPHSSRPWSFGWPHALSTVAVIVLSLTVLIQMREQTPPAMAPASPEPRASDVAGGDLSATPMVSPAAKANAVAPAGAAAAGADREVLNDEPAPSDSSAASMLMEAAGEAPANRMLQKTDSRQRDEVSADDASPARTGKSERDEPEAWLAEIRRLREAGLDEQADEELALFRQHWPDIPVPEGLD